jgi:tRNA pseudouridine55 synthase
MKILRNKLESEPGKVVLVDKPSGPTSHDVVLWARRSLGTSRVGHSGTLDPFASGLLLIMSGWATRISEYLTVLPKTYCATIQLGVTTDTDDSKGQVLERNENWQQLSKSDITNGLKEFEGQISQVPPQYSAKKVQGERMYRKARRGEKVKLDPVKIEVFKIFLTELNFPSMKISVECSSGTYIRSLARDLGTLLGVGAHVSDLRRLSIGEFSVENCIDADSLRKGLLPDRNAEVEVSKALGHLRSIDVGRDIAKKLRNGIHIRSPNSEYNNGESIVILCNGELVGIAETDQEVIRPKKILPVA